MFFFSSPYTLGLSTEAKMLKFCSVPILLEGTVKSIVFVTCLLNVMMFVPVVAFCVLSCRVQMEGRC